MVPLPREDNMTEEQKQEAPETCDISKKNALAWERFTSALQSAAGQLNHAISVAQSTVAMAIIESEGKSPKEWVFDMDNVCLVKVPKKE